jgi:hypothetical protein
MDLNIDNYSLKDLLHLFKLPDTFTESQLKEARKRVIAVHPDKSGLDKSYFIFFHKAYTLLDTVYKFKQKAQQNMSETMKFSDIMESMEETDKKIIASTFTSNPKFNQEFNKLFDTLYIKDDDGYGDWLKSNDDLDIPYKDRKQMSRALITSTIEAANHSSSFSDLKQVYTTDTVMGVSEEDYRPTYKNIQELKEARNTKLVPLDQKTALQMIEHEHELESKQATERAFRLLQQEEINKKQQQTFWSSLLKLT